MDPYFGLPLAVAALGIVLFLLPTNQHKLTRVGEILFFLGVWVALSQFTRVHVGIK